MRRPLLLCSDPSCRAALRRGLTSTAGSQLGGPTLRAQQRMQPGLTPPTLRRLAQKLEATTGRAPKPRTKPRSAWHVFMHEAGPGIVAARPDATSIRDRVRVIADAWNSLSPAGKQQCARLTLS